MRSVAFLSGGYVPATVRGSRHFGFVSVADWYASILTVAGADPTDDAPGVPPTDSIDVLPSLLGGASTNSTPRTRLPLSWNNNLTGAVEAGPVALHGAPSSVVPLSTPRFSFLARPTLTSVANNPMIAWPGLRHVLMHAAPPVVPPLRFVRAALFRSGHRGASTLR